MILQRIYLKRARWYVTIYHSVDVMCADEILDELIELGCHGENLKDASNLLWGNMLNNGITYSNCSRRETIIVIGETSSGSEYWNSIDHEKQHLLQDISLTDGIDPYGEEISYISGEFIREVYLKAGFLLCDCCRKRHNHNQLQK